MYDEKLENEFRITVGDKKLEETRFRDGQVYVVMPLLGKESYGVEFVEEIKGHGKVETSSQKWPVCPYKVAVRNVSNKGNFAALYVDGQKVAQKYVMPNSSVIFEGIPTENGIQELLFSLPRYPTVREKEVGGRSLPNALTNDLGTVKIVWHDCVKTGKVFSQNYRSYGTSSFTQANKVDMKACGNSTASAGETGGAGSFASSTRAGKVVGLNESRSCEVTSYSFVGEPWSARVCYRTKEYLEEIGVLQPPPLTEEAKIERKAKRQRRRKRRRELADAERGGAPCPSPVAVVDDPPPAASSSNSGGSEDRKPATVVLID